MLNLAEYRHRADRLADHLPWAALVAPGVVLNKDGSFQRSFRFRGPDLESATEAELLATCARLNNLLRRFGSGWALFFEAERFAAPGYPDSEFPDAASWLVDSERRAAFEQGVDQLFGGARGAQAARQHFESAYHLTLLYMPPADPVSRAERMLVETGAGEKGRDWRHELASFIAETDRALDLLVGLMPEVRRSTTRRPSPISTARSRPGAMSSGCPRRRCISTRCWSTSRSPAASRPCWATSISAR